MTLRYAGLGGYRGRSNVVSWKGGGDLVEGRSVRVVPASAEQLALAAAVLEDASLRLRDMGWEQWPVPFPVDELLFPDTAAICYLAWDADVAAGTFTLQRRDPLFWPEAGEAVGGLHAWGADGTRPVYLHRFATKTGYPGLGRLMLGRAEAIARGWGATCLRLDCVAADVRIRRYYEDAGFEYRGDIQPPHLDFPASRYEKRLEKGG
jgi:GNAT superfamily N-acetyltransferase